MIKKVIEACSPIHAIEMSQRPDGVIRRLTTYKIPLYQKNRLIGLLGLSSEHPISSFQLRLTPREQLCVAFMAKGFSDKEIATKLGISRRTVKTHFNSSKVKRIACRMS